MIDNFYKKLKEIGVPVAYSHFKEPQSAPYMIYYIDGEEDIFADNKHYKEIYAGTIELYTTKKDFELERKIKYLQNQNTDITIKKVNETYLSDEGVFLNIFDFEII